MNILIAGDFVPQCRVLQDLMKNNYEAIFGNLSKIVHDCDYSLINLEAPIVISKCSPINKCGPNLKVPVEVVEAIKYSGFKGVTLANNHFYDYGEEGVSDTIKSLIRADIDYVGGGYNINEARRILYKNLCGHSIAFINCCENEYSIATETSGGSNPLDLINIYYSIQEARSNASYVIIVVHGGIEGYQLPTPRMQETYRFFIDIGADVVINHHQHCYSGYEYYKSKPIFYGLGNFCFDWDGKRNSIWNEGYVLKLSIEDNNITHTLIPYIQGDEEPTVVLMDEERLNLFESSIRNLNEIISNPSYLKSEHENFMKATERSQKYALCPFTNKYLSALYVRNYMPLFFPLSRLRELQNKIMCESHRERILFYLSSTLK